MHFGRVWGWFWEAKILNFRINKKKKTQAKNKKFGRPKNRILRLKSKLRAKRGGPCGSGGRNPPPPEGRAGRAGQLFLSSSFACPYCLPQKQASALAKWACPHPFIPSPGPAHTAFFFRNLLLRPKNAFFLPSKNRLVFCLCFFSIFFEFWSILTGFGRPEGR